MAARKTGRDIACPHCGTVRYWSASDIRLGRGKTCGAKECRSKHFSGKGNPFWGKTHSESTRKAIKAGRAANPPKGTGPKKGVFKHTEEAKNRISEASKRLWAEKRDMMLASLPRGEDHIFHKNPELRRYRKNFTPFQRREWRAEKCAYCGTTDHLELDHIIPVFDGGTNARANCQTLCRGCNLWKTHFVDLPRYNARLGCQGG